MCSFTIAVKGRRKNTSTGEWEPDPYFCDCEAWNEGAQLIARLFRKGDGIIVRSQARTESWEDRTSGEKKSRTRYRVEQFDFPPGRREPAYPSGSGGEREQSYHPPKKIPPRDVGEEDHDHDLEDPPF